MKHCMIAAGLALLLAGCIEINLDLATGADLAKGLGIDAPVAAASARSADGPCVDPGRLVYISLPADLTEAQRYYSKRLVNHREDVLRSLIYWIGDDDRIRRWRGTDGAVRDAAIRDCPDMYARQVLATDEGSSDVLLDEGSSVSGAELAALGRAEVWRGLVDTIGCVHTSSSGPGFRGKAFLACRGQGRLSHGLALRYLDGLGELDPFELYRIHKGE